MWSSFICEHSLILELKCQIESYSKRSNLDHQKCNRILRQNIGVFSRYIKEHTSVENQIEDDNTRISFLKDFDLLVKSDFCLSFIVELIIELYYILYEMNLLLWSHIQHWEKFVVLHFTILCTMLIYDDTSWDSHPSIITRWPKPGLAETPRETPVGVIFGNLWIIQTINRWQW